MNDAGLVKALYNSGYKQKLIQMITGYNQPYISKVVNGKSNVKVLPTMSNITEEQFKRKEVIDAIIKHEQIPSVTFGEQDELYIQLMDFCNVDREAIRKLYYHVSNFKVHKALTGQKLDLYKFNAELIGVLPDTYKYFLDCVYKKPV